jgi:hypothetical protein
VAVRRVVMAEDLHRPQDFHPVRIGRDQEHRVAAVLVRVRVGAGHDDVELATRCRRRPKPTTFHR